MRKPPNTRDTLRSIDEELYSLSYEQKLPLIQTVTGLLQKASIEANDCNTFSEDKVQVLSEELEKMAFAIKKEKPEYKEFDYEYIAPETSALVKPNVLTDEQFARIAGLIAPKEEMSALIDRLKQTEEQAKGRTIQPILINEDDWE